MRKKFSIVQVQEGTGLVANPLYPLCRLMAVNAYL